MTVSRVDLTANRPLIALRNTAIRAVGALGPAFPLRGMDGIADRRPPPREPYAAPYAARTQARAGQARSSQDRSTQT
ncbi:hypothetical protein ACOKM3_34160 [Streptomyces sp. BH106]|uniref:hypothetical protein n=1 Tax=Streptomyces sp. BH106 TaxID=3410409 RepID=UPI003CF1FD4D